MINIEITINYHNYSMIFGKYIFFTLSHLNKQSTAHFSVMLHFCSCTNLCFKKVQCLLIAHFPEAIHERSLLTRSDKLHSATVPDV